MFVFLICSERSGSNFITSLMGAHPAVSAPPPTHLFRLFGTNMANYGDLMIDDNWTSLVGDVIENFQCKLGVWNTAITAGELLGSAQARTSAELLRVIYQKEAQSEGATHIFVKENHTYSFAPYLLSHFPDCRFVFMVRDPRDVAASWVITETIPGGVKKAVDVWTTDQRQGCELYHQLRGSGRISILRYEDLVTDPQAWLQHLTDFLGLSYEPAMLEFYKEPRTVANSARIDAWSNLSRPIISDNTGKYFKLLSEADRRYIEMRCYDLMQTFGYIPDVVTETEMQADSEKEVARLSEVINPGNYVVRSEEEQGIRIRRLEAINRVLNRRVARIC